MQRHQDAWTQPTAPVSRGRARLRADFAWLAWGLGVGLACCAGGTGSRAEPSSGPAAAGDRAEPAAPAGGAGAPAQTPTAAGSAAAAAGGAGASVATGAGGARAGAAAGGDGPGLNAGAAGAAGAAGRGASAGSAAAGAGAPAAQSGSGGSAAPAGASAGSAAAGSGGESGSAAADAPVYRVPLRVHIALSKLTQPELETVFAELNEVWLSQAGVCFEIEVTSDETDRSDGFDFRYTAGKIPGASSANGLTQSAHAIWSIDHPNLGAAPHPIMNPTARTTAHELGHALGLAHENPPPSRDCSSPCYCVTAQDDCDDYLMRSGTKGFFLSKPEIEIARMRAARSGAKDTAPRQCGAAVFR